jgi:O-antigen/teichoic acid export membrane protein
MSAPGPEPAAGRFQQAVLWNFASLAVLGVSGIALTTLIGRWYAEAALGVFQQVLATYTIFSMLAVWGLDRSALRAVAEHHGDRGRVSPIVVGAFLPGLALALASTAVYWFASGPIGALLESPAVTTGIRASTPGLFFFALNKVLLAVVNGVQRMRAFAVYQALRYLLILLGLIGFLVFDERRERGHELAFVFTIAEGVLFLPLAVEGLRQLDRPFSRPWGGWCRTHLDYGARSFASGVLLEIHAKVDVWMLGYFLLDGPVGIYAFGGMIAEGIQQLLVVLQNMFNPIIARMAAQQDWVGLRAMFVRARARTYLGMVPVGILAVLLFPTAVRLLTDENSAAFLEGWPAFAFLVAGITLASGWLPFAQTLLMTGHPGWHTVYMIAAVGGDAILNWLMIPVWGLEGAAASTAIAMVGGVLLLRVIVRRQVGLKL